MKGMIQKQWSKLFGVIILIIYAIYVMPKAPGDFYMPFHIANLFFPNFGINFEYSLIPDLGKSMITYYIFNKIILQLVTEDVMEYYIIKFLVSMLFKFLGFLLLFSLLPELKKYRIMLATVFTIGTNFPGIPVLLIVLIFTELVTLTVNRMLRTNHMVIFIITLIMVAFYWHTLSAVVTIIIISYLSMLAILRKLTDMRITYELYLLVIASIVVGSSWIYLRDTNMLKVALINILHFQSILKWEYIKLGLFSRGSLVPSEYLFDWHFFLSSSVINIIRWISYIVIYIYIIKLTFILFKTEGKNLQKVNIYLIASALLIADMIDKITHYLVIKTVGMTVWFILIYPLFFSYILKINLKKFTQNDFLLVTPLNVAISSLLVISFLLTSGYYIYTTATQLPSTNTLFNTYEPSFWWAVSNIPKNTVILSDSDTAGYYTILYAKYNVYQNKPLYFKDIRLQEYDKLYHGLYNSIDQQVLVLNLKLYQEHLVFGSLRYWDRFKPLPPRKIFQNNLAVIYNSNLFIFAR